MGIELFRIEIPHRNMFSEWNWFRIQSLNFYECHVSGWHYWCLEQRPLEPNPDKLNEFAFEFFNYCSSSFNSISMEISFQSQNDQTIETWNVQNETEIGVIENENEINDMNKSNRCLVINRIRIKRNNEAKALKW